MCCCIRQLTTSTPRDLLAMQKPTMINIVGSRTYFLMTIQKKLSQKNQSEKNQSEQKYLPQKQTKINNHSLMAYRYRFLIETKILSPLMLLKLATQTVPVFITCKFPIKNRKALLRGNKIAG
jgi:hypothetical protein